MRSAVVLVRPARAQRTVRCMLSRAYSWLTGYSGHSSSAIRMSLPKASCTSTVDSGVKVCGSPFRCERNTTPSSVDLAQAAQAEDLEPARIGEDGVGPGHEAVQPAHPADRLVARAADRDDRCWPAGCCTPRSSARSRWVRPLTVACVPTGMNTGFRWSVRRVQQPGPRAGLRALGHHFEGELDQLRL